MPHSKAKESKLGHYRNLRAPQNEGFGSAGVPPALLRYIAFGEVAGETPALLGPSKRACFWARLC